jgi:hypothetical protein
MDQIENFNKTSSELEKIIRNKKLDEETKKLVETAMEFGYSAGDCLRTIELSGRINGSSNGLKYYTEAYEAMKTLLKTN